MWTSARFGQKPQIFRNLWCACTDKDGGVIELKWTEGGVNFCNFVRTSFMDGRTKFLEELWWW